MENKKLIAKLAWTYSQKSSIEFNEMLSEANLAYLEALQSYDPSKAKISTHVWNHVSGRLKDYIKAEYKHKETRMDDVETDIAESYSENIFESFTTEAMEVVRIIIDSPWDLLCLDKKQAQKTIKEKLKSKGWDKNQIVSAFSCLEKAYN
jgi:hypothetical protein